MGNLKKLLCILALSLLFSISASALDLDFLTSDIQVNAGESASISVLITDNGTAVNNTVVNFTTDMGILNSSSAVTNASGIAEVTLNSTSTGTAHVNASTGNEYDLANVTFLPSEISSILVESDHSVNTAGNITNITFTPVDMFGNVDPDENINLNVIIKDQSGNTIQDIYTTVSSSNTTSLDVNKTDTVFSYTGSSSKNSTLCLNSTIAGNITINSTAGPASNMSYINITAGSPALLRVVYDDDHTVNTNSSIYVSVYDVYENPVEDANVTFSVTSPANTIYNSPVTYNSASIAHSRGLTDINGKFANIFTADKRAGNNVVQISVINTTLQSNITISGLADRIDDLFLTFSPENALSNNEDCYTLSARPVDQFLNPIIPLTTPIKEQVRFTTDDGNLVLVPLNSQGRANTIVGPTPYIESLSVTATYRNESGYTNFTNVTELNFTAGPLYMMDFYSVPNTVLSQGLNGNHKSTVTLVALDEWGHSLPDINVTLNNTNTTVGTLTIDGINSTLINATTDSEGRIYGIFEGNVSGNTTIIATSGDINRSANISVKSEPFMSVNLSVQPTSVTSGDLVNITTIISVEGELPITRPAASAMLVLDRSGSMDPDYYAGTPLDVVLVIDRSGSMGPEHGNGLPPAKEAARKFTSNLVSNSQIGVVSFGSESRVDLDLTLLNSSANLLLVNKSIDKLGAVAGTALGEGMADANNMLINEGRSGSRKVMILLTDGEASRGTDDPDGSRAVELANANGITIYTIGLGSEINEAVLRSIASDTGGNYYSAPSSSDLSSIYNAIAQDICDYDITDIEYGEEGFTPYSYTFNDSIPIEDTYTLSFEGYDFDDVFDASPYYGGTSAGECLIKINGDNLRLLPSTQTTSNSGQWKSFNYDITDYVHSGENSLSFYDYYDYTGYKDYYDYYGYSYWWSSGIGNNRVKNVVVKHNGNTIQSYSTSTLLDGAGYTLSFDAPQSTDYFEDTLEINESLDDFKVELQWEHEYANLDLQLESPAGRVYGIGHDATGYYPGSDGKSEYIWIQPLSGLYEDGEDAIETGTWTVRVTGISNGGTGTWQENFTISTYIDKKSAVKISSHAFISSFDESRGDKAGLSLYSFEDVVQSNKQTSYVLDNSTWVGYFTVDEMGYYTFNVSWDDTSSIDAYLYDGIEVLDSSGGTGTCEVSSLLSAGNTYHVEVVKGAGPLTDTRFTINVSTSPMDSVMAAYYDSNGGSGSPRYRTWDGSDWSGEESANYVEGRPYSIVLESNPLNSEFIMSTGNDNYGLNVQIWDGSSWNGITKLTDGLSSYSTRGFDIKYEQKSGDAIAVYGDGYWTWVFNWWDWRYQYTGFSAPRYSIWDGSSWSSESTVDGSNFGAGDISWVRLEANPNSNEMVLVTLDDARDMRAQIWDGSSWDNQVILTDNAVTASYQCFDVMYEQASERAIVVWADNDGHVKYRIWDGNSWDPVTYNMYSYSSDVYWIKMAAHPNLDKMILAAEDRSNDIYVTDWNGSSWQTPQRVESDVYDDSRRSVDVTFEQNSGKGIVVWGDGSSTPKYGTWNGSTWDLEYSASSIGSASTCWVQLTPDISSDAIFLMTSDSSNDLNIQKWDGSSWDIVTEVETSSSYDYECFDLAFSGKGASAESTSWNQWTASVTSTLENDSLSHLENAIDTMTADGLTAIDEGMYAANNELSSVDGNSTMVIMTDGLDNAGYHSLLEEAYRAKENDTVIYTVGFGNNESEVDPVLAEVAEITGGEYYFAPNSSVLKDIFTGIASQITNFSAGGPVLDIHVPHNYITSSSAAKATYISGSSNSTTGNATLFMAPTAPATGNAEPTITTSGNSSSLEWQLPNMGPGDKWGVWYQMRVDGAGYVPIIMPTSTVTYTDLGGENITVYIPSGGSASVGGGGANVLSYSLGTFEMVPDRSIMRIGNTANIGLTLLDTLDNSSFAYVHLYSNIGYFENYENPINVTVVGSDTVDFTSINAGKACITAYAYNVNNVSDVLIARDEIYVRPKGMISIS